MRFLLLILMILSAGPLANAQSADPSQLKSLQQQQKEAEARAKALAEKRGAVQGEIDKLQNDLIRSTAQSRGYEREAAKARKTLTVLEKRAADLNAKILADRQSLTELLAALQRIDRNPPPALVTSGQNAVDGARAAMMLASLSDTLDKRSKSLSLDLQALQTLKTKTEQTRTELNENVKSVETRLSGLKSMISKKSELTHQLDQDRAKKIAEAKALAAKAETLRDLIESFERAATEITPRLKPKPGSRQPAPKVKPNPRAPAPLFVPSTGVRFADTRGSLPLPVIGNLARKFGQKDKTGQKSKGVHLKTAPKAQVVAPFEGRVEFAGLFNDDHVVILNVGSGYFIVLTGLADSYADAGSRVDAGELLGIMPGAASELFMELRKDRSSIDPMPWISRALSNAG